MITSVLCNNREEETKYLTSFIKDIAAKLTDESWIYEHFKSVSEIESFLSDSPLMDLLFYDVSSKSDSDALLKIRSNYKKAFFMILSDMTVSPMVYMKPGIQAQSLLLRPWDRDVAYEAVRDFIKEYVEETFGKDRDKENCFLIETREEKVSIPYSQIYYIEAMDKKVFICTGADEYGFYETLDELEAKLPDNFKRSHRSFIVNMDKIVKVALSQNTLFLKDDFEVPLSRSYKPDFKGI